MGEIDQTIKRQGSFWFTALPYFMCVGCWILGLFSGVWYYHNVYRCELVAVPIKEGRDDK